MARRKQIKVNPKWSLPSLAIAFFLFLGYQVVQEFAFPLVVHEQSQIQIKACFTPNHNCQKKIIKSISLAEKEILILCYYLTAKPIAEALEKAFNKGVDVKIIADRSQRKASASLINELANKGIPVWIDKSVTIAHNKVLVIDQKILISGSYNLTNAAEYRNAENILFIQSKELAKQYKCYWQERKEASTPIDNQEDF